MTVPNIVKITLDDCGLDQLDVYGLPGGLSRTPNIDALKTNGIVYNWAYGNLNCSPTRTEMGTGRKSSRTGIGTITLAPTGLAAAGQSAYPPTEWEPAASEVFIASRLTAVGYATSCVGKWHMHHAVTNDATGWDFVRTKGGFQDYRGWPWNLNPVANPSGATETKQSNVYNAAVTGAWGYPRLVNGSPNNNGAPAPGSLSNAGGSPTDYCATYITTMEVNDAIARVAAMGAGPWYLELNLHAPHVPLQAPPQALYNPGLPKILYPTGHPSAALAPPLNEVGVGQYQAEFYDGPYHATQTVRDYSRAIMRATDTELGRLFAVLPNNTIIILCGDNGTGDSPGSDGSAVEGSWNAAMAKNTLGEAGIRLPLIVSQTAGTGIITSTNRVDNDSLISFADIHSTICDLAGAAHPTQVNDSTSFYTTFSGGAHTRKEVIGSAFTPVANPALFGSTTFTQRWYYWRGKNGFKIHRRVVQNPGVEFYQVADSAGTAVDQYETTNLLAQAGGLTRLQKQYWKQGNSELDSYIASVEGLPVG